MLELKVVRPLATAAAVVMTFLIAPVPSAAELACGSPPEGFESGLPPGWTSAGNSPVSWGTLAACGEAGNFTGGVGDAACVSGSLAEPGAIEAELRTSSFSLAGVTTARLEMRLNYQHFAAGDSLDLEISDDGGWSWTLLRHDQRDLGAFAIADGDRVEVDLSGFAGRPELVLRWRYSDPAANALDWYAQIDEVGLVCDPVPPCGAGVRERNRLADGGFEAGSPSAVWEEYSDNFPSPICTPASCGLAGAQAGDAWAFFGGTPAAETASLVQSFTLFPGPATLSFFAWTAAATAPSSPRSKTPRAPSPRTPRSP
ncbi:MAG: hypothetical protein GY838_15835, partial [bacterium]|nr:hypothetical protein [bacterium]